jgi:elongation factor P
MKTAQELRAGNVFMAGTEPTVVIKAEYNKSGRNSAVVKMKLRSLLNGSMTETVYKADEKFDVVILDKKAVTYSYFNDPMYVFMDENFEQYEIEKENTIIRTVAYTEPAAKGDTSGKVMKVATLANGYELQVAAFIEIGERIEIDSRTGEFKSRAKG